MDARTLLFRQYRLLDVQSETECASSNSVMLMPVLCGYLYLLLLFALCACV